MRKHSRIADKIIEIAIGIRRAIIKNLKAKLRFTREIIIDKIIGRKY